MFPYFLSYFCAILLKKKMEWISWGFRHQLLVNLTLCQLGHQIHKIRLFQLLIVHIRSHPVSSFENLLFGFTFFLRLSEHPEDYDVMFYLQPTNVVINVLHSPCTLFRVRKLRLNRQNHQIPSDLHYLFGVLR